MISGPTLITFHEKHDDVNFVVNNDDEYETLCRKIATKRAQEGYWYDQKDNEKILELAKNDFKWLSPFSGKTLSVFMAKFIKSRRHAEYEGFSIKPIKAVGQYDAQIRNQ